MTKNVILSPNDWEHALFAGEFDIENLKDKINELYKTPFSDIAYLQIFDPSLNDNMFYKLFLYEGAELRHIILFKHTGIEKRIEILNNCIYLSVGDIGKIAPLVFKRFKCVNEIFFKSIFPLIDQCNKPEQDANESTYNVYSPDLTGKPPKLFHSKRRVMIPGKETPYIQNSVNNNFYKEVSTTEKHHLNLTNTIFSIKSNDVVIELPDSLESYMSLLGKKTRKNLNNSRNRIDKNLPGFRVIFLQKEDIKYAQISKLVELKRRGMKIRNRRFRKDNDYYKNLFRYVSEKGLICLCYDKETLIGGSINSVIGKHCYGQVLAHNGDYSEYNIGNITLLNTIKYLIENEIQYLHLLWGKEEYKFKFRGINRDLYNINIFRKKHIFYIRFFFSELGTIKRKISNGFYDRVKKNKAMLLFFRKLKRSIEKIT